MAVCYEPQSPACKILGKTGGSSLIHLRWMGAQSGSRRVEIVENSNSDQNLGCLFLGSQANLQNYKK